MDGELEKKDRCPQTEQQHVEMLNRQITGWTLAGVSQRPSSLVGERDCSRKLQVRKAFVEGFVA